MTTRCAICNGPRADHGNAAVADHAGNLGPWHEYHQGEPVTIPITCDHCPRIAVRYRRSTGQRWCADHPPKEDQ